MSDEMRTSGNGSATEGGSGYCEHGSSGPCPDCDGIEVCPKCNEETNQLHEVGDWTDHDEVCGWCIKKHGDRMAREGERLQGQRTIEEQRRLDRDKLGGV